MKKCKHCQSEIDKKARVCPVCRKKQRKSTLGLIFGGIIIFIGFIVIATSGNDNSDETKCSITLDEFNQIENGMTYNQIVEIVGCEGTLSTDSSYGDSNMKIYYWYADNGVSNATFSFMNNALTAKSQIGL